MAWPSGHITALWPTNVNGDLAQDPQTFYVYKRKYAGLGLSELRELRQLREENAKLKRLVADFSLDRHMLPEIVRNKL